MSRLLESLVETIDELQALPVRTLNRRVGCIMTTGSARDVRLAEKITGVRLGLKTDWSHGEIRAIARELELEERSLHDWLVMWSVGLERVS
jgi:hypothetical protein